MSSEQPAVELAEMTPEQARGQVDELRSIYADVYAEPPYLMGDRDAEEFRARFLRQSTQDGFRLTAALHDGRIVGFCYTITLSTGRWWKGAQQEPGRAVVDADKVAVIELVLLHPYRGHGTGRALLDMALADRTEPYATLLAEPDAPAMLIYQHWGWTKVGTVQSQPHWKPDYALVLPLAGTPGRIEP